MPEVKDEALIKDVPTIVRMCDAIRKDANNPTDVTLAEFVKGYKQLTMESFYDKVGINPNRDTIANLVNLPDQSLRWLIPEIFRDAIRLGLRKAPLYPQLVQSEMTITQPQVTMPAINMSDATPKKVGVAETIPLGDVSFGSKKVSVFKMGRGIKIPDEVRKYVSINLVSLYMQDFGIRMGMGLDVMALTTLLNGDQADGSDSTAVIGIATAGGPMVYRDLLRPWVRMGRLGKNINIQIAGEEMGMDILELLTYSNRLEGTPKADLKFNTPIPQAHTLYIHGNIPDNKLLLVDKAGALIKLNLQPLLVETERIVSNQTEATYASFATGFATIYRDSRLVLDKSLAFGTNGFPTWMDPKSQENAVID